MKKKIGYIFLILISIIGSRLIFGKDYHLNSNNLLDNNLYLYDIFNKKSTTLTMVDDEYIYYVLESKSSKKIQYDVIKYNLINNKVVNQYILLLSSSLKDIKMFKDDGYIYLTAINSNTFYKFNNNLDLIGEYPGNIGNDSYGVYNNKSIVTLGNQILYQDKMYDTLPNSCGKNIEIIYEKDTYLHFHNIDTGFGCLYNINNKKREYLDYEKVQVVNDKILEYQDNRLSFKYNNSINYFNDITESTNLKMHINGDYLFTIDMTNYKLRIYNLDTSKIINEKIVYDLKNRKIKDILIDDYAYFTVVDGNDTKLYIWDYLKEKRINNNMISYNEKEYKFKNNELKEELKNKYNVNVYIYDQAVNYFQDAYVIPSYDDILINSRLLILKEIFDNMSSEDIVKYYNMEICLVKDIISSINNSLLDSIFTTKNNHYLIAINITNDNFKSIIKDKLIINN